MPDDVARYPRYRFPPTIISHAVWLYYRFTLSFRDVEDLLVQRGITPSHTKPSGTGVRPSASPTRDGSAVTEGPSATRGIWTSCSWLSTAGVSICGVRWIKTVTSSTSCSSPAGIATLLRDSFASS